MSGAKNQGGWGTRNHTGFRAETKWYGPIGGRKNVRRCFYACFLSFFGCQKQNQICRGDKKPTCYESLLNCY